MSDNPLQCTTIQKKTDITNEVITLVDVNSACLGPDGATFNITGNVSGTCASMDYFLFSRVLNTDCSSPVVRKCSILNRENSESCQFKCTCPEGSLSVGNEKCHLTMTLNPLTGFSSMDIVGASSCHDSLIFMSTHKATAARCLSHHQATYGPPPSAWPLKEGSP